MLGYMAINGQALWVFLFQDSSKCLNCYFLQYSHIEVFELLYASKIYVIVHRQSKTLMKFSHPQLLNYKFLGISYVKSYASSYRFLLVFLN